MNIKKMTSLELLERILAEENEIEHTLKRVYTAPTIRGKDAGERAYERHNERFCATFNELRSRLLVRIP